MNCLCGCETKVAKRYAVGHARKGVYVSKKIRKRMSESHIGKTRSVIDYGRKPKTYYRFYNTKPERFLKSMLSVNGIEYDSQKQIFGVPDIFIEPNICIFVDGCYWHECKKCGYNTHETTSKKSQRDILVNEKLKSLGYMTVRIWEHEIYDNLNRCLDKIRGEMQCQ